MKLLQLLAIMSLLSSTIVHAAGQHSESLFGLTLTLELILLITVSIALVLSFIIFRYAGVTNKKLVGAMVVAALGLLLADYLFLKYIYFGGN